LVLVTLPAGADEAGGPPFKVLRASGQPPTIDIEIEPFERARSALGTTGYKDTVNEALRRVHRAERLRRGAEAILADEHDLVTPEDLDQMRQSRI